MRPTERREKVVEGRFVRHVYRGELKTELKFVPIKNVVVPDSYVEQMTGSDSLRIMIRILGPRRRYPHQSRTIQRRGASGERCGQRRTLAPAE